MTQVLISSDGNHSPDKWAAATAAMIFPVDEAGFVGDKLVAAKKKEIEVIELLSKHHAWHQNDEIKLLDADQENVLSPIKSEAKIATSKIVELMHGSPWEDHFKDPDVQWVVEQTILSHTHTNRFTERSWHADRHPDCHHARKFKDNK